MTKSRVLVVDDEEGILRSMEHYFRQRGDDCMTARNGREALQLAHDRIFDVVLSDISMPGMDGLELIKRLKEIQPQTVCVLMSGLGTRRDIIMALQIGVFDFVDKPIPDFETFTMVVDRAAERSRLVRERDGLLETLKEQNAKLEFSLYQLHEAFGQLRQQEAILQSDLAKAQRTQRQFLPSAFPQSTGLNLFGYYAPCELLGGDFFGYVPSRDGRLAVYVADVAGHGVSAAMFTVTLHELIRGSLRRPGSEALFDAPELLLAELNEALAVEDQDTSFLASVVVGVFQPETGKVRVASAGHPPPIFVGEDGRSEPVAVSGPVLGARLAGAFTPVDLQLGSGDFLLMYTDGVTEARNADGTSFTPERLRDAVAALRRQAAAEIGNVVETEVRQHLGGLAPNDDLTFIVASRPAQMLSSEEPAMPAPEAEGEVSESVKVVMPGALVRARSDSRGRIHGGWLGRECIIRCAGSMTWQHAAALRDLIQTAKAKEAAAIALHLADCESLDSTMLGLLLQSANDVVLHQPTGRVVGQFDEMGLLPQFTISHKPCPLPEVDMQPVASDPRESCSDLILSAHEALMEVSATNRARFKDVVDTLRQEQQAEPKNQPKGETT